MSHDEWRFASFCCRIALFAGVEFKYFVHGLVDGWASIYSNHSTFSRQWSKKKHLRGFSLGTKNFAALPKPMLSAKKPSSINVKSPIDR
jgi:hypothetical protein